MLKFAQRYNFFFNYANLFANCSNFGIKQCKDSKNIAYWKMTTSYIPF